MDSKLKYKTWLTCGIHWKNLDCGDIKQHEFAEWAEVPEDFLSVSLWSVEGFLLPLQRTREGVRCGAIHR